MRTRPPRAHPPSSCKGPSHPASASYRYNPSACRVSAVSQVAKKSFRPKTTQSSVRNAPARVEQRQQEERDERMSVKTGGRERPSLVELNATPGQRSEVSAPDAGFERDDEEILRRVESLEVTRLAHGLRPARSASASSGREMRLRGSSTPADASARGLETSECIADESRFTRRVILMAGESIDFRLRDVRRRCRGLRGLGDTSAKDTAACQLNV
jgi:hypothetical protein